MARRTDGLLSGGPVWDKMRPSSRVGGNNETFDHPDRGPRRRCSFSPAARRGRTSLEKTPDADGKTAGFLLGLWHGFISPVTFIVSIFSRNVRLYEVHNNGGWYNFGFVLGAGLFLSGGILGRKKKKR